MRVVRLWTSQAPGFDIVNDRLIPERSQYWVEFKDQYTRLYDRLGETQYVWCWTVEPTGQTEVEDVWWSLQVPSDKIIAYVVEHVWERLIGRFGLPNQTRERLRNQAASVAPGRGFHAEFDRLEREFWAMQPSTGDW